MIEFNMVDTVDFINSKPVFKLLKQRLESIYMDLYDDYTLMRVCELYKIVTNDDLLDSLDPGKKLMCYLQKEFIHPKFSSIADNVHNLGFYFAKYDENKNEVHIVTSMNNINNHQIELYFSDTKVRIYAVTPLNYELLSIKKDPNELLEPSLVFFRIVADAVQVKATDVHFMCYRVSALNNSYPIKYRIGNDLVTRNLFYLDSHLNSEIIKDVMRRETTFNVTDIDSQGGVNAAIYNPFYETGNDLRLNVTKTICGYKYTVRIMGAGELVTSISNLGFKPKVNLTLERVVRSSNGLTLVTGPQRSGKNTTLFAILNQMVERPLNIVDYSSPVETIIPGVIQVNYNGSSEYLDSLVKSCKKHDVDIALINELPNKDIANSVYDLVNSSVGVMTTFHINRIWHLCYKLQEYFGDNIYNLFTNLNYVFNQKIFIKQCPHCQDTYNLDRHSNLYPEVIELASRFNISSYKQSRGCKLCNHTGVQQGIQPYVEYIVFDEELRSGLFNCSTLHEMELLIKNKVMKENTSLEYFVIADVLQGTLHPNQLVTLL